MIEIKNKLRAQPFFRKTAPESFDAGPQFCSEKEGCLGLFDAQASLMILMSLLLPKPRISGFLQPTSSSQKLSSFKTSITNGR